VEAYDEYARPPNRLAVDEGDDEDDGKGGGRPP
jgi:hypothetical protein